jgi:Na+/H+ antiporter NhaD/arsenite permease-like protein
MIPAVGIFAVTYLLIGKPRWPFAQLDRPTAGLIGAVLMIAAGLLTPEQAYQAIDWDTIVLLLGMFVLSGSLRLAGFFEWAAEVVLTRVRTPIALLTALVFVSGLLSALLVNDTVCVMLAPLVIALIERSDLPVLPYLFALAVGANIGSVMTVVGNPQNMIIAHAAPLSYAEFARVLAPIGVVNLGLTVAILCGLFRQDLQSRAIVLRPSVIVALDRALLIKTGVCLALVVAGFVSGLQLAWTALGGATLLLLISGRPPRQLMAQVDGPLLLFFGALFIIIAGLNVTGVLTLVSAWVLPWFHAPGLLGIVHFSWVSVLASNVFSNVPYVLVAANWVTQGANPHRLWLLLALTSTFAGNLTLFGSVANVIVFETAGAQARIGFWQFLRIGAPLTLLTTAVGVALLLAWG